MATDQGNHNSIQTPRHLNLPGLSMRFIVNARLLNPNATVDVPVRVWVIGNTDVSVIVSPSIVRPNFHLQPLASHYLLSGTVDGIARHSFDGNIVIDNKAVVSGPFIVAPHDISFGADIIIALTTIAGHLKDIDWRRLIDEANQDLIKPTPKSIESAPKELDIDETLVDVTQFGELVEKAAQSSDVCLGLICLYAPKHGQPDHECDIGFFSYVGNGKREAKSGSSDQPVATAKTEPRSVRAMETLLASATDPHTVALLRQFADVFSVDIKPELVYGPSACRTTTTNYDTPQPSTTLFGLRDDEVTILESFMRKLIEQDFVRPSIVSEYTSQAFFVKKQDGTFKVYLDSEKDSYAMKRQFLSHFCHHRLPYFRFPRSVMGKTYVSKLTMARAYHNSPQDNSGRKYTKCYAKQRAYMYTRVPFRDKPFGKTSLMQTVDDVISGIPGVKWYLDEIVCESDDWLSHISSLKELFTRLRAFNLVLDPAGCSFAFYAGPLVGHDVSQMRINITPTAKSAIAQLPTKISKGEVERLIRVYDHYGDYVQLYAKLIQPLRRVLEGEPFGTEQVQSLSAIRKALTETEGIKRYEYGYDFVLEVDVSDDTIGMSVFQPALKEYNCVGNYSRPLKSHEIQGARPDKELLALLDGLKYFKSMLMDVLILIKCNYGTVKSFPDYIDIEPEWIFPKLEGLSEYRGRFVHAREETVLAERISVSRKDLANAKACYGLLDVARANVNGDDIPIMTMKVTLRHRTTAEAINKPDLIELLKNDRSISRIYNFHTRKNGGNWELPLNPTSKVILNRFYVDCDQLLWYEGRLVIPRIVVEAIVKAYSLLRQTPLETWWALARKFYHPELYKYICLRNFGNSSVVDYGDLSLNIADLPEGLFKKIHLEVCNTEVKTFAQFPEKSVSVLIVVCVVLRLTIYIPFRRYYKSSSPSEVHDVLVSRVFRHFGTPEEVFDNSRSFDTNEWATFFQNKNIVVNRTHDVHVQGAAHGGKSVIGAVQRIKALFAAKPETWPSYLPTAQYVTNVSYKCDLSMSPLEAIYGGIPRPWTQVEGDPIKTERCCTTSEGLFIKRVDAVHAAITKHVKLERLRPIEQVVSDGDHGKYRIGELVLVKRGGNAKYCGPYHVLGRVSTSLDTAWNVDIEGNIEQVKRKDIRKYTKRTQFKPTPASSAEVMKRQKEIVGVPRVIKPGRHDPEGWIYLQFEGCRPFDYPKVRPNLIRNSFTMTMRQKLVDLFLIGVKRKQVILNFKNLILAPVEPPMVKPPTSNVSQASGGQMSSSPTPPSSTKNGSRKRNPRNAKKFRARKKKKTQASQETNQTHQSANGVYQILNGLN